MEAVKQYTQDKQYTHADMTVVVGTCSLSVHCRDLKYHYLDKGERYELDDLMKCQVIHRFKQVAHLGRKNFMGTFNNELKLIRKTIEALSREKHCGVYV